MVLSKCSHALLGVLVVLHLFGAGLHVWWFWLMPTLPQLSSLTLPQWHLLALFDWAATAFILVLAALVVWAARSRTLLAADARFVLGLVAAFWVARLIIELTLPISVPLLGAHTTTIIKGLIAVGLATLGVPLVELQRRTKSPTA